MKKSRTGKKIARAIALGLATMITLTSVPVSTFADSSGTPIPVENHTDGGTDSSGVANGDKKEAIVPQEAKDVEAVEKLITKEDTPKENAETGKEEFDPGVDQAIDIAQDVVKKTNENEAEDKDIKNADGKVSETLTDLQNAEKYMKDAAQSDQDAMNILQPKEGAPEIPVYIMVPVYETDENGVEKKDAEGNPIPVYETDEKGNPIQKFAPQLVVGTEKDENGNDKDVTYDEADSKTGSDADDAIRNANTANTTNSQKIAEQAKAAAESAVSDAKKGLADIEKKLEADSKKAAAAQEAYNKADKENKKAQKAVEDAQAQLDEALKKAVDENGDPITDKNGNPIYEGDVEAAEQALIAAKKTADKKAKDAETAWNNAQNADFNEIVTEYELIQTHLKNENNLFDSYYWEHTRKLCNLMIKNYIRSSEKDNGLVVGDNFEVQLINGWEPDGEPHTITDEDGNVVLDDNDAPVLWQDYKVRTENGYVTFKENKNNGYLYDENGITVKGQTERKVYNWYDWIPSGYSYTGADGKKKEDTYFYNHVVVTYNKDTGKKDEKNGEPILEKVIELYNYKNDANGEIYIYKRDWNVEDDKNNVLVEASDYKLGSPAVPKGDDTPASWATGADEGSKKITVNTQTGELELPTATTHAVAMTQKDENGNAKTAGYWIIDTESSKDVTTDKDKLVAPPVGSTVQSGNTTTTVSYDEVKNEDGTDKKNVRYEHGTYTVVDEWNKKPVTDTIRTDSADELKKLLNQYKTEGKTVSSVVIPFRIGDYSVDLDNTSWVDDLVYWFHTVTGGKGYSVDVSYEVDDTTSPKTTHEEDGIYEIVEKEYKETTENETKYESDSFGVHIEAEFFGNKIIVNDAKGKADKAMRNKVASLESQGYEVIDYDLGQELFDGKWGVTYWVKYKATTSQTVTKEVSRKLYAADTYSTYNALVEGDPAKPATSGKAGNDAKYGQKIVIQNDSEARSIARKENREYSVAQNLGEYIKNIQALQENKSELAAAAAKVNAALTRVQELKERIKELENVSLASTSALNELNSQLQLAQKALADANSKKEVLAQKVAEAQKVVDSINLDRFKSSAAPGDDDPGMDDQDNPDDDDDDDSSSDESVAGGTGTYAGTGTIIASSGTAPVIPLPATAAGVAGARTGRRTSRSGVAGVRVDNGEGDGDANGEGDAAKNVVEPKAVATTNGKGKNAAGADKKFVKLENNEVPLADKPFEEGTNMNLLWLLAAAIAAGAGVYAYDKHRKKVAAADEVKKYKKN